MTDICKCTGEGCPLKENCYRFTSSTGHLQSYFLTPPYKDGKCERYWEIKDKNERDSKT